MTNAVGGKRRERGRIPFALIALAIHTVAALASEVVSAFQLSSGRRRESQGWHRATGRLVAPLSGVVALTALWLNQFTPLHMFAALLLHLQGSLPDLGWRSG